LYRHCNYRLGICISFRNNRGSINILWKATHSTGNFIPNIIGGSLKVLIKVKFNIYIAGTLATGGANISYPVDGVDLFFERFGDLALDNIGVGSGITGAYRNNCRINTGKFPNPQISKSNNPKKDNCNVHYNCKYRALYT